MSRINYTDKQLRAMFGKPIQPTIPISLEQISIEAQKLAGKLSISGVQPKLSVRLEGDKLQPVAKDGQYILKPQTQQFAELPQNEYLCMQMGRKFGLNTAESILLELSDGTPAYLVKRFDRFKKGKHINSVRHGCCSLLISYRVWLSVADCIAVPFCLQVLSRSINAGGGFVETGLRIYF